MYAITEVQRDAFASGVMPGELDENLANDINYMREKDGRALVTFDKGGSETWACVDETDALCDEELCECLAEAHAMIVSLEHIDGKSLVIYSQKMDHL